MKNLVKGSGLSENASFKDLEEFGCRELRVYACDLNDKKIEEFSVHITPTVRVAEAVRASMSIPLFFQAWQFPDNTPDNHFYVDGGMDFNYPITVFDNDDEVNYSTLGFHIDNLTSPHVSVDLGTDELILFIKTVFDMLLKSQVLDFLQDENAIARTVRIDDFGIPATDFSITNDQQNQLYESGRKYTEEFIVDRMGLAKIETEGMA